MKLILRTISILTSLLLTASCTGKDPKKSDASTTRFETFNELEWTEVLSDSCTTDWTEHWTLDGLKANITHDAHGMSFTAGPVPNEQASHAVLWTKDSFAGDIKIEYEFTRLDDATKYVNILYIQATGSGEGPYAKDISQWAQLREIPWMKTYFNNMDTYHISYAAYGNDDSLDKVDYIRARRYLPLNKKGLSGTALEPDYHDTGFFAEGLTHKITVIKKDDELFMHIESKGKYLLCHWKTDTFPPILAGRIGLRHMWTRSSRYANIRISQLSN